MQNLLEELKALLIKEPKYLIDGDLLKNKIIEDALKLEPSLLKLLLKNKNIRAHFFVDVGDIPVFDKVKFQEFVSNKAFLPDSYTAFKNKIGLNVDGKFLKNSNDVVLSWAYKDCVLEGGMTKEETKGNVSEIFYNETLAPDEITRLLDQKVLTNFEYWDEAAVKSNKAKKPSQITENDNLLIKGNNLLALHCLKKRYAGKVKLIYIDPPYNTGNDGFRYNDSFNHSTWLTFMKNRLEIARDLLADDGSIFVQIDDNELGYLKVLLDQIFHPENFINNIVWKRRGGSANPINRLNNATDYLLWYSKKPTYVINHIFSLEDENTQKYIEERFNNFDENGRRYMKSPLQSPNPRPNLTYEHKGYKPPEKGWSISKENMIKWDNEGKLYFPEDKNQNINRKIYLDEYKGQPVSNIWTDIKVINPMSKERLEFDNGQKPESLLERIITLASNKNDLVLDFFAGSGTTPSVAHKMNRRWIAIEQMNYIKDLPEARLKRIIEGEQGGVSKNTNWQGGGSFIYCQLKEWNEEFVQKVRNAKTSKELLAIYEEMKQQAFFRYDFEPQKFDNTEFAKLPLEEQQKALIDILDKNHLYVNYSEIEDK